MKHYYDDATLAEIKKTYGSLKRRADQLMLDFTYYPFSNTQAREFASHGFSRRLGTLRRCIENVFKIIPPRTRKIPSKQRLYDAQINLQSFIANVYGSVDNLAWVWAFETGLSDRLSKTQVGLKESHKKVRDSLGPELQQYLKKMDPWFAGIIEYRDALAHRIPLYVPPGGVLSGRVDAYNEFQVRINAAFSNLDFATYDKLTAEQEKLLVFRPVMTHSLAETTGHYPFHVQMLTDFVTIEDIAKHIRDELKMRATES